MLNLDSLEGEAGSTSRYHADEMTRITKQQSLFRTPFPVILEHERIPLSTRLK